MICLTVKNYGHIRYLVEFMNRYVSCQMTGKRTTKGPGSHEKLPVMFCTNPASVITLSTSYAVIGLCMYYSWTWYTQI